MRERAIARVLTIAGSDSGGGAGIEADIKTISALGGYACTAITAVTAQNTTGIYGVHVLPAEFVALSIATVLGDIGADAIKIGMLAEPEIAEAVAHALPEAIPLVLDPVLVASSGAQLLSPAAVAVLRARLIPRASLVTPNLPEAAALTGLAVASVADAETAGRALLAMGAKAVLVKGGHGAGETLTDVLVQPERVERFTHRRIAGVGGHGTGCALAAGIATGLGQGMPLAAAVARAERYLQAALAASPGLGKGAGPVWHGVAPPGHGVAPPVGG